MPMIEVLTGIGLDEYDESYAHVMNLTPIFNLPQEIRTQLLFAFADLAKKCREKAEEIRKLKGEQNG